jgi:hypothetical protein
MSAPFNYSAPNSAFAIRRQALRLALAAGYTKTGRHAWRAAPGRFEGSDVTTPYWQAATMDGGGEYVSEQAESFELDANEREAFGCDPGTRAVVLFSDQGFIEVVYLNRVDFERFVVQSAEEDSQS